MDETQSIPSRNAQWPIDDMITLQHIIAASGNTWMCVLSCCHEWVEMHAHPSHQDLQRRTWRNAVRRSLLAHCEAHHGPKATQMWCRLIIAPILLEVFSASCSVCSYWTLVCDSFKQRIIRFLTAKMSPQQGGFVNIRETNFMTKEEIIQNNIYLSHKFFSWANTNVALKCECSFSFQNSWFIKSVWWYFSAIVVRSSHALISAMIVNRVFKISLEKGRKASIRLSSECL